MLSNGVLILGSILLRNVVKLVRVCVVVLLMGLVCVILGFFVEIKKHVDRNLVRYCTVFDLLLRIIGKLWLFDDLNVIGLMID